MEVMMNGAPYIVVNPAALVPVEQPNAMVSVKRLDGILPIQTVLQEPWRAAHQKMLVVYHQMGVAP
jgi:hypothetical protein